MKSAQNRLQKSFEMKLIKHQISSVYEQKQKKFSYEIQK